MASSSSSATKGGRRSKLTSAVNEAVKTVEPGARGGYNGGSHASSSAGAVVAATAARDADLSLLEAALEAWAACQPNGYTLPEEAVPGNLAAVASHVPGNHGMPEAARMMTELFENGESGSPVFQQLLKIRDGQVHFLDFWRGFSKATYLVTSITEQGFARDEGITMELEIVRDGILRSFEAGGSSTISRPEIAKALRGAADMSKSPEYWRATEKTLTEKSRLEEFSLEDLSVLLLAWLKDAVAWQHREPVVPPRPSTTDAKPAHDRPRDRGPPVLLHIYDVSQEESVAKLNRVLAHKVSPLKFGGVFHAGVEVMGLEWSYGMSLNETVPGVSCCEAKSHTCHTFRQTVTLKPSRLSQEEIAELISKLIEEYPGDDYHLLRRNCCHFADDFCRRLGAGGIPGWVHRLARLGANVDFLMQRVLNRSLLPEESDDD